ncbi:CLUMA_CG019324, isoform A [Clunio marinus]|uniref:CLUMA_CG019324, isoform A n=1 Tax=Clunio marinus TaxID=568069 RepID=A0A1J1J148_9DIPT|nr:CLUMA_CG019324, isoform A [Clunio marinus]
MRLSFFEQCHVVFQSLFGKLSAAFACFQALFMNIWEPPYSQQQKILFMISFLTPAGTQLPFCETREIHFTIEMEKNFWQSFTCFHETSSDVNSVAKEIETNTTSLKERKQEV